MLALNFLLSSYLLALTFLLSVFIGCQDGPLTQVEVPVNDPSKEYNCDDNALNLGSNTTKPEYKKYYFVKGETRPIFVYGKFVNKDTKITLSGSCLKASVSATMGTGTDLSLRLDSAGNYKAVVYLDATAKENTGKFYCELTPCNNYDNPEIEVGADRKYVIQYNCMAGYNVFNTYPDSLLQHIKRVFNGVNTEIALSDNNTAITPLSLGNAPNYRETIWRYLKIEGLEFDNNWVYLTGLSVCTALNGYGGITIYVPKTHIPPSGVVGIQYAIPCYFGTHISKIAIDAGLSSESTGRLFAFVVIHELAHARAMEFTVEDGYPAPGYTLSNDEHTAGHDGVGKYTCLMLKPDEERLYNLLSVLNICSGHKQMLFNAKFKP